MASVDELETKRRRAAEPKRLGGKPPPERAEAPAKGLPQSAYHQQLDEDLTLVARIEDATQVDLNVLGLVLGGHHDGRGRVAFRCPVCQTTAAEVQYPQAFVVDALHWDCWTCKQKRTLWELRDRVLKSPRMLEVLLENLGVEVAGR